MAAIWYRDLQGEPMSIELQASIIDYTRHNEEWQKIAALDIGVSKKLAEWLILTIIRMLLAQYTGGLGMDFMGILKGFKQMVIAAGLEDELCGALDKIVQNTATPIDDQIANWIKDQWAKL